ncbi:MAG: hypothetical protein ABI806_25750 [Candidatus Solibacter sp.]
MQHAAAGLSCDNPVCLRPGEPDTRKNGIVDIRLDCLITVPEHLAAPRDHMAVDLDIESGKERLGCVPQIDRQFSLGMGLADNPEILHTAGGLLLRAPQDYGEGIPDRAPAGMIGGYIGVEQRFVGFALNLLQAQAFVSDRKND